LSVAQLWAAAFAAAGSAVDPFTFALFSFLPRIASRASDFFKIPHDAVIEVAFRVEV
jgi:KUP system potassium uptake protein